LAINEIEYFNFSTNLSAKTIKIFPPFSDNSNMNDRKQTLIAKAFETYKVIFPCSHKDTLYDCFTTNHNDQLVLWFNTADGSTRIIIEGH
jgi:hypothetical protein